MVKLLQKVMDADEGIIHSNLHISPDRAYILYVGDVKYLDTTTLLLDRLSQRYGKPVEIINILPNMPPSYIKENVIVINKRLADHMAGNGNQGYFLHLGQPFIDADVSNSPYVRRAIDEILRHQKDLFINVYKSTPEMRLPQKDKRISVIGPDPRLVERFDDKLNQRMIMNELGIPVPRGYLAYSFEELISLYQAHFEDRAYVACARGFGGNGSETVSSLEELMNSEKLKRSSQFIVSDLLDLESSPASLGIVANEDEVLVVSLADQLMNGVSYGGTVYPSNAGVEKSSKMREYTITIGKYLGSKGYRGFFGIDFMIDKNDNLYFVEINPRKIGSSPESILAYNTANPAAVSVPELEFMAITQGTFGDIDVSAYTIPSLHWGVLSIKAEKGQKTLNYVPRERNEHVIFRESGITVLDHPGEDITYLDDGKLARAVCVVNGNHDNHDRDPREVVLERLEEEKMKIKVA